MNKRFGCLIYFLIVGILIGPTNIYGDETGSSKPIALKKSAEDSPYGKINVLFNVTPRQENKKLYFDIETNLPDGMIFMGAIRDEDGFVYKTNSTMARVQTGVTNGRIMLGPFPLGDKPFPSGEYKLIINSYPEEDQPENVTDIVGPKGENLTGQHVIGGMILFEKAFMITG